MLTFKKVCVTETLEGIWCPARRRGRNRALLRGTEVGAPSSHQDTITGLSRLIMGCFFFFYSLSLPPVTLCRPQALLHTPYRLCRSSAQCLLWLKIVLMNCLFIFIIIISMCRYWQLKQRSSSDSVFNGLIVFYLKRRLRLTLFTVVLFSSHSLWMNGYYQTTSSLLMFFFSLTPIVLFLFFFLSHIKHLWNRAHFWFEVGLCNLTVVYFRAGASFDSYKDGGCVTYT